MSLLFDFYFVGEGAWQAGAVWFYVQFLNRAVVDEHREPLGAETAERSQIDAEIQGFDEGTAWVS